MSETLVDKIVEYIHQDIINLTLMPDQRLHIAELAEKYQVGPGPVREALSRLMATELVLSLSQRGFRVAPISKADLFDVYRTRAAIEALALQLSIQHGGEEWEANVIASHYVLAKFESEHVFKSVEDYQAWEERHRHFNAALLSACGLSHLLKLQTHLYQLTERYRRRWLLAGLKSFRKLTYASQQEKIMKAAIKRDSKTAIKLLQDHYEKAVVVIEAYFLKHHFF